MTNLNFLKVNEIFYSIQGEGKRAGHASIFIRLSGCNLSCSFCDTKHKRFQTMTLQDIRDVILGLTKTCRDIVWTGGEPTLQLKDEHTQYFKDLGYFQAIETNGILAIPKNIDYVVISPKAGTEIHIDNKSLVDEVRFPIDTKNPLLPTPILYNEKTINYLSPIFSGPANTSLNVANINLCVSLILENPKWKLSIQTHKLIGIP